VAGVEIGKKVPFDRKEGKEARVEKLFGPSHSF
jgi:hypothetical protein